LHLLNLFVKCELHLAQVFFGGSPMLHAFLHVIQQNASFLFAQFWLEQFVNVEDCRHGPAPIHTLGFYTKRNEKCKISIGNFGGQRLIQVRDRPSWCNAKRKDLRMPGLHPN
jgi:hypothetical protein